MMFVVKVVEDSCYFFNFQLEEFERMIEKLYQIIIIKELIFFFFFVRREISQGLVCCQCDKYKKYIDLKNNDKRIKLEIYLVN